MSKGAKPVSVTHPSSRYMLPSKAALTRSAILDAGSEFLETRPFRDLTVGILMATTEYSRPTFYLYFNDLHGLLETLLDEVKEGIVEGAQAWLSNESDGIPGLQRSLRSLVDVGYEHGTILRAVSDAAPSDARLENVWETFLNSFDEVVSARIEQDQAIGVTPEFDPLPVARALNRMDAGILINAFGAYPKAEKEDVLSAITRIWLATLYPFDAELVVGNKSKGSA
ncbi:MULTISPECIES: TetR/AcrR family transcriptional regulator [Roseobacteraceae]|nr:MULTISPECIES: TetR/AcrR family transcriptional regulator [Roseobacteraceae]MBT3143113.1 TetR/AcrR family transcriptional regulator [Falsiruegeria litorea]MBT8171237.1 TetR/AcrR family transcriptional regulator [Falsiruegeria litorea]